MGKDLRFVRREDIVSRSGGLFVTVFGNKPASSRSSRSITALSKLRPRLPGRLCDRRRDARAPQREDTARVGDGLHLHRLDTSRAPGDLGRTVLRLLRPGGDDGQRRHGPPVPELVRRTPFALPREDPAATMASVLVHAQQGGLLLSEVRPTATGRRRMPCDGPGPKRPGPSGHL